jgi:hypothetical protein
MDIHGVYRPLESLKRQRGRLLLLAGQEQFPTWSTNRSLIDNNIMIKPDKNNAADTLMHESFV